MGFPSFLLSFFLVFHLLLSSGSSCPFSFDCGRHGQIKFPFTNDTYPGCGLCVNCSKPVPEVELGEKGKSILVSSIHEEAINISDPTLKSLIEKKSCDFFSYFHPPNNDPIPYTISPSRTSIKCNTSGPDHDDDYIRYLGEGCHESAAFYLYRKNTVLTPDSVPRNCARFQLPGVSSDEDKSPIEPFSLLTSDFAVEYHFPFPSPSPPISPSSNVPEERGQSHLGLILGIAVSSAGIMKESIVSLLGARGTAGYIAQEVFSRNFGGVSHKSDVYSYGMMVLEIVGGRKNISDDVDHTSEIYFPHWVYKRLELDEDLGLHGIRDNEANASARGR
ncbi:hypothetical protein Vadar_009154 [Vaccinium darrowii]|uniref:Uncharacterized protein n=1 Tax=Vaccinium darrowii TaxID=229202 RepID=A0ACB7XGA5_9ERIC|nr:hypothetical protein Vadar_009154 [Vaccinium darrowii]